MMNETQADDATVPVVDEVVDLVRVGQRATLDILRFEMTALTTLMGGLTAPAGIAVAAPQTTKDLNDADAGDAAFDNMPV